MPTTGSSGLSIRDINLKSMRWIKIDVVRPFSATLIFFLLQKCISVFEKCQISCPIPGNIARARKDTGPAWPSYRRRGPAQPSPLRARASPYKTGPIGSPEHDNHALSLYSQRQRRLACLQRYWQYHHPSRSGVWTPSYL
jgi:hypothetical protein